MPANINNWHAPTPMFYVYMLRSKKDDKLYLGSTNDLKRRFTEHNAGKVISTRLRKNLELIYYKSYNNEKQARIREHNLKLRSNALGQLKRILVNSL